MLLGAFSACWCTPIRLSLLQALLDGKLVFQEQHQLIPDLDLYSHLFGGGAKASTCAFDSADRRPTSTTGSASSFNLAAAQRASAGTDLLLDVLRQHLALPALRTKYNAHFST